MKKIGKFLLVLFFIFLTLLRNSTWRDEFELWSDVLSKNPVETRAYYNLGVTFYRHGEYFKAIEYFKLTLEVGESYDAAYNLGVIYGNMGDYDNAIKYFSRALEIKPEEEAYFMLKLAIQKKENIDVKNYNCDPFNNIHNLKK